MSCFAVRWLVKKNPKVELWRHAEIGAAVSNMTLYGRPGRVDANLTKLRFSFIVRDGVNMGAKFAYSAKSDNLVHTSIGPYYLIKINGSTLGNTCFR